MKIIVEYDLSKDQDFKDYEIHKNADGLLSAMCEFDTYLRNRYKYPENQISDQTHEAIVEIRDKFYDCIAEYNSSLDC